MTTKHFRIFSTETGHDFGTWEGVDAADVLAQMAEQAGADVDASIVEVIELTAASFVGKRADVVCRVISPRGEAVEGVKAEQDWDKGETTFRFEDGTAIVVDDTDVRRLDSGESNADDDLADMLGRPVLAYQTSDDTGRVATAEDVARQVRAGEGAYECPVTGASVYISR